MGGSCPTPVYQVTVVLPAGLYSPESTSRMALPASFVCVRVGQGKDERDGQGTGGGGGARGRVQ